MASMSVSGIVSGMDWEGMIDEIITNAAKPAQVKVNKKTNLTNKKSLFEEMKVTMNSLQSSLSPLKLPSTYKAKTIDIERIDKNTSYKGVLTATANADAEVNVWDLTVNQLATAQINRSKQINDSNLTSTLNGVSGKTIYINAGGQKVGVEVKSSDTLESLKSRINTTLKTLESPIYVTASVVDNKLLLKSDYTGLGTMTGRETINYNYSTGINRLSNLSIPEEAYDNVKITSSGKSYTIHKDFEIANGNEIRWKQYDRGNEVALGDSATVKYMMAKGDTYKSTGTADGTEASISGFSWIHNGTLASRLKISDGTTNYTYGTDFTLDSSGTVEWIEAATTTNEPASYTVSYSKTTTETVSATGTKAGTDPIPSSYKVSYKKQLLSPVSVTVDANKQQRITSLEFDTVSTLDGISINSSSTTSNVRYIIPNDESEFTLTDGTTEYIYGKDYILRSTNNSINTYTMLSWNGDPSGTSTYIDDYAGKSVSYVHNKPVQGTSLQLSYTHTYTSDNGISDDVLDAAGTDYDNIIITDSDGKTYTYGTDFTITNGAIEWYIGGPDVDDDINSTDFANLQTGYNAYIGADENTDLPTVTLLDSDGVVRTYFDPKDRSMFTMTATDDETGDTISYEYGRDYVIRVNDTGDGYVFSWAVTSDTNRDGSIDIKDANTEVTTYTAAKGISTSGWKAAPSADSGYSFNFEYTKTESDSKTISKTATDKPLATVLSGVTIDSEDYSTIKISDGTKTYTYGTDWEVVDGNISWKKTTTHADAKKPTGAYTLTYEAFSLDSEAATYNDGDDTTDVTITTDSGAGNISGTTVSYEQILGYAGITSTTQKEIDSALSKYLTLTDGSTTYVCGTDYRIIQGDEDATSGEHNIKIEWISGGKKPSNGENITLTYNGRETISTSVTRDASDTLSTVAYNGIKSSTVTITQGSKTYYEGVDFELSGDSSNVVVTWKSDKKGGYEWYYPNPGSSYTLNVEDSNGTKTTYSGRRTSSASLNFMSDDYGMTTAGGSISVHYGDDDDHSYRLDAGADSETGYTGYDVIKGTYGIDITPTTGGTYTFNWVTPKLTTHSNLPSMNDELTVEYQYDANTFDLSDDGDGDLLYALGFTKSDGSYDDYTKAQGAEIVLNGETIEVDSNDIGADYDNEIIKGVTLHLKGTGEVTMDISHDAEKAVESIQSFVDNYNDLMTWMNTRMTEKELDKDTAATVDSDDFRMRWGLLHGNSLLRQTKSQMRSLTSKNFTFTFTQRKSSEEIYGSMAFNGLKTASTLRLRIGSKYVDITIDPSDTLETIVAKLSDDTKNGPMHDFYYDENGQKLQSPLIKASVENDKLEIHSTDNQEITMSGSAAMNALKMNYTYKGLYQIGIESTSDDYGKSGELVFDTDEFMTALEDNPDEVQALMTSFVSEFSAWTSSMLNTSASGETKGTLTREIDNIQSQIDTINEYLERYQERLDRMEENLRTRYGNTETQFSKLSQQANSIAAILNQLNGTASGGGYGQASS